MEGVGCIQSFDFIKTQHVDFKSSKKACVLVRQSVRDYIMFALLILGNVRKRLHELNSLSVSLTQVGLAFEIFQRLMVGMYDKFFGPKVVLPNLKNTN